MKRLLIISVILLSGLHIFAAPISKDAALLVAKNFIDPKETASSRLHFTISEKSEDAFYLFEDKSGEGWVLVSGDDVAMPVLGYSYTGKFGTANMPLNLRGWLSGIEEQILYASKAGIEADEQIKQLWSQAKAKKLKKIKKTVEPLIQSKWDQVAPFNNYCPYDQTAQERTLSGCVATAMAQLMYFYRWPEHGYGSHSYQPKDGRSYPYQPSTRFEVQSADFENTYYDWSSMLDYYIYQDQSTGKWYYRSATDKQKDAVALLLYHCGVGTEMMYGLNSEGGSTAYALSNGGTRKNSAQYALSEYFGYKSNMKEYHYTSSTNYSAWVQMLKDELDAGRPMLYGGYNQTLSYGHSFICDGYSENDYFHFNWGWSGLSDGYFLLSALTPGNGGAGGGTYDFKYNQEVVMNIEPNKSGESSKIEEPEQKDYIATKAAMTYYPQSSDITTFKENNISLSLYVTEADESYSAYFYFNMILPEYNRLDYGLVMTENEYTAVEILKPNEEWYYICGDEESTLRYYRYFYEYQEPNCEWSDVTMNYKGKDSKGNLLYDIKGKVRTKNGNVYTISATEIAVEATSAVEDDSQADGYRYSPMTLQDDQPTYLLEVVKSPKLVDISNDLVPLGTNQVKISATLKNTGTQDFEGRLSGLIYIKKEGEWQYLTKTGHTAELTFSAGKSTILNFNLQNASSLVAGEYMFVAVYGKDAKHWFRMHGQSTYYFVVDNPDDPQIATKEDDAKNDNIYSLEIYTPLGILLKKVEGSDLSIDEQIKSFSKGLYILSINNQSGVSYIKR